MKKESRPIALRDLGRSIRDCYRIEDAMYQQLRALGCDWSSDTNCIRLALTIAADQCPQWCEQAAWEAITESFARWAGVFGDLRLFMALRRKRDE